MSRPSPHRTTAPLASVDAAALAQVTGGRIAPRSSLDPVLLQGLQQLSQAIVSVGQNLAGARQAQSQQLMQLMQQLMASRGGR